MTSNEIQRTFQNMGLKQDAFPDYVDAEEFGKKLNHKYKKKYTRVIWDSDSGVTFSDLRGSVNTGLKNA